MRKRGSGFGKPRHKREEPREVGTPAAAPEPATPIREQVRGDDSEEHETWQSHHPDQSQARPRPKPWRRRTIVGTRKKRGPRRVLNDQQRKRVRRFLFGERGKPGRNAKNNREKLEGMLWVFRTGAPWRDLHGEFGDWSNIYHTFRRWAQRGVFLMMFLSLAKERDLKTVMVDGTFIKVHQHGAGAPRGGFTPEESKVAQAIGLTKGGLNTKLMALVDRRGRLVTFSLVPGNAAESQQLKALLADVDVTEIEEFLGDKAFDNNPVRALLEELDITVTVPWKRNRKQPIPYDEKRYKGRHLVENGFADLKHFRGLATRYCKYAHTFCGGLHLATWHLRTRGRKQRSSPYLED